MIIKVIKSSTTLSFKEKKHKSFIALKEEKAYDTWRLRILISIIFGYGAYYLCRQNFSMIIPAYMEEFNYSKIQLGWILSFASIIYGVGKLVNGYISDRSNARYFMTIGHLTTQEIFNKVFINKNMCIFVLPIYIFILLEWALFFGCLYFYKNISLVHAGWQVAAFEIIGLFGGFTLVEFLIVQEVDVV